MPEQTPVEGWFNYAQQLPENAPDVLYDAQRDKYFDAVVRPWAYQNGYSPEETRQEFMKRTERLDKAAFPRIELGAKSAARALIDPIAGAAGEREVQAYLKNTEDKAALEAARQGINPAPYAMIGSMAGQLPYWYAGMELAGLAAGAVVPEAATGVAEATAKLAATRKLFNVAAGAMVQGSYDAAKAEDGHRMLEGSLGALEGGAGMAVFEYAKPLWQILRGKFNISEDVAKAIEATTKGVADEAQTAEAAKVVEASPDVAKVVADAVAAQVRAGKKGGRPRKSPLADASQKAVSVEVASNPQQELAALQAENARLKGQQVVSPIEPITIKPEEIPQAADIISQVLDKGGSLDAVNGHPVEVNELLRQVDDKQLAAGTYDTPLELRGEGPQPNIVIPGWVQDSIEQQFQQAQRLGIVQQIEDLSAQRLTAGQVAKALNLSGDAIERSGLVRAVRSKLNIPSLAEPAEFEAWLQKRKSTALVDIPPKPGYNEGMATPTPTLPANPLIASLRKVLLDPKLTEVQKSASRVRLQRLSPETVEEVDAMLAKPGAVDLSPLAAAPGEVQGVSEELALAQEASRKKAQAEGVGQPTRARLGLEDVSEYDQLEVLKSGKVRDKLSGRVYANADEALRAKGLSAPDRFARREAEPEGFWIGPEGQIARVKDHAQWAMKHHPETIEDLPPDESNPDIAAGAAFSKLYDRGYLRVYGNAVELGRSAVGTKALNTAVQKAAEQAKLKGQNSIHVDISLSGNEYLNGKVELVDIGEFLQNPVKYLRKLRAPEKFATEEPPSSSRRSFLKQTAGAAGSLLPKGALGPEEAAKLQGALKAAEVGNKTAFGLIKQLLEEQLDNSGEVGAIPGVLQKLFKVGKHTYATFKAGVNEGLDPGQEVEFTRNALAVYQSSFGFLKDSIKNPDLLAASMKELSALKQNDLISKYEIINAIGDASSSEAKLLEKIWPGAIELQKKFAGLPGSLHHLMAEKASSLEDLQANFSTIQKKAEEEFESWSRPQQISAAEQRSGTLTPGSELQRTPEWELGPYGPGQFQRASKMRYANGVEGEDVGQTTITERPTQTRITGQLANQTLPPGTAAGISAPPGQKPTIYYRNPNPTNMFHEGLHAGIGYLDLAKDIDAAVRSHPTGSLMQAAFDSSLQKLYGPTWPEEAYVYAASAVRTKNSPILDRFIDADTDRATVLRWIADNTQELLQGVAQKTDSVHKLVAERRLKEVLRRSTGELSTIARDSIDLVGDELRMDGGKYVLTDRDATAHVFDDRDSLVGFLESRYSEPLSAPQLVDESLLPADLPRYAADSSPHSLGRTPVNTTPPPPELMAEVQGPKGGRIVGGVQAFSNLARPFYAWLDTVARKNEWPELYSKFKALDLAEVDRQNFERPYRQVLSDVFKGVKANRRDDFYRWLEASTEDKPKIEQELHLSDAEIGKLNKLRNEFYDPLYTQFGISPLNYIESYAPRMRANGFDPDAIKATGGPGLTPTEVDFFAKHVRSGELDPKDTDLLRVSDAYLRLGSREKYLSGPIEEAAKLVNMKTPGGEFVTGSLQPLLKRHIEAVRGIPDYTNRMIDGAANAAKETINDFLESYNKKVPGMMQIEPIEATPRDIMSKWILFSYAGGLAGRPMVAVRDFLTTFITGYPILGGKYIAIGAKKAFEEGAWKTALEAGALLEKNPLRSIYNAGEGGVATGATKVAEASLTPLQWSNNVSRLISFWGHTERALDAMKEFSASGNVKQLVRESAMTFLDENLQKSFVQEIASSTPEQAENIAHRIAKELTEVEHWNYRTGANPGIYRYTLGRLFGQYGTWPLNYIEYIRRIVANGDKVETAKALTRLAIAHGAIIAAGEAAGIDTAQWVFTQPMAYGGGPLFQAVVNIPGTMDFESYRGAEARKEVVKPFFPGLIPGGLAAERLHKALVSSDPEVYKILLGFVPLKSQEKDKFWHQIVP